MSDQGLFGTIYNPDVLTCLANLSNDEVFTSPEIANQMLDMLPQELFKNPNTKFLDPACKSGVFLREIAKRLIDGLAKDFPDLQERIDHIFHNQLYGIAITELTSLLSRRSVYCSKYPNSEYSISQFDNAQGNIRFKRLEHTWNKGKCIFCGASRAEFDRSIDLETHAYEFIHTEKVKEIFNMKFDVIISNPPYQINDGGGTGDSARPIYQKFVEQAMKLNPSYITMIIPSRWLKGGKGLDDFRNNMMNDTHIKELYDYEDASECFSGINLDGGVLYFLWDKKHNDKLKYTYKTRNGKEITATRYLKNKVSNTVIRDYRQISIIEKINSFNEKKFNSIVSSRKPFGIATDLFNKPERYPKLCLSAEPKHGFLKIYGVKGKKGGAKRQVGYINPIEITDEYQAIDKYKLYFSYAYSTNAINPPAIIEGKPYELSTETFLLIGPFETKEENENCLQYMQTKFFKALLFFNRIQKNASSKTFELIPIQDFKHKWTDEELFKKYNLDTNEINFINSLFIKDEK